MKIITIASVLLLFFLFSTQSCLAISVTKPDPHPLPTQIHPSVYDTDGDVVLSGVPYFMVSAIRGPGGGGLDLGWSENQRCPRFVMEHWSSIQRGTPVVLTTAVPFVVEINVFAAVNITFVPGFDPICRASTKWTVDGYDPWMGKGWINTGGSSFGGLRSWFIVSEDENFPDTYNINACYRLSDDDFKCSAVDRFGFEDRFRRMGFQEQNSRGWAFKFEKAPAIQQVGGNKAN